MAAYDLLLFDADGTLFDYDRAEKWALEKTLESCSIPFSPEIHTIYRTINSSLWKAFERGETTIPEIRLYRFSRLFSTISSNADPAAAGELYLLHLGQAGFLIDGATDLLQELEDAGKYRLALITNGITETQYGRLAASGTAKYFDPIIISGEAGYQKPDPAIFALLFEKANHHDKERALIIGDSLSSDIQGGINFGIDTCWYNPHGKPADPAVPATWEIRRLSDLSDLLNGG